MGTESTIRIGRPSHRLVDRPMAYTVWIDGTDVGAIHDGESQRFPVAPGVHRVRLGISGRALGSGRIWTSQEDEVETREGEEAHLVCMPTPLRGIFRPHHRLNLVEGTTSR